MVKEFSKGRLTTRPPRLFSVNSIKGLVHKKAECTQSVRPFGPSCPRRLGGWRRRCSPAPERAFRSGEWLVAGMEGVVGVMMAKRNNQHAAAQPVFRVAHANRPNMMQWHTNLNVEAGGQEKQCGHNHADQAAQCHRVRSTPVDPGLGVVLQRQQRHDIVPEYLLGDIETINSLCSHSGHHTHSSPASSSQVELHR